MTDDKIPSPVFHTTTIADKPPEPIIGPGMVLSNGRRIFKLNHECRESGGLFWTTSNRRKWFAPGWTDGHFYGLLDERDVRTLLLSGFRVIRPADTKETP